MNELPAVNGFIGESAAFRAMLAILARIARYDTTVLITGETGSGKEMAARAIHYQGQRQDRPQDARWAPAPRGSRGGSAVGAAPPPRTVRPESGPR